MDGDVQAAVADGVVGGGEAPTVTELGQDRGRTDRANAVEVGDQGTASGLAASERAQRPVKRGELAVDRFDRSQRQRHQLAPGRGELRSGERLPAGAGARLQAGRNPLVQKLCLQPLLPSGDRKSTRLNSSHVRISYAVFCLKKKKKEYANKKYRIIKIVTCIG